MIDASGIHCVVQKSEWTYAFNVVLNRSNCKLNPGHMMSNHQFWPWEWKNPTNMAMKTQLIYRWFTYQHLSKHADFP